MDEAKLEFEKEKLVSDYQRDMALQQARLDSAEQIAGAQIGAKAEMEQQQIKLKEVLEGAKLGAEAINKENDYKLRAEESQARNASQVKEVELKDETKLNERE